MSAGTLFYYCTDLCNKNYKTPEMWENHMKSMHNTHGVLPPKPLPIDRIRQMRKDGLIGKDRKTSVAPVATEASKKNDEYNLYTCSGGCNKKYKTLKMWLLHMNDVHGIKNPELPDVLTRNTQNKMTIKKVSHKDIQQRHSFSEQKLKEIENALSKIEEFQKETNDLGEQIKSKEQELNRKNAMATDEREAVITGCGECVICIDNPTTHVIVPCGHQVLCGDEFCQKTAKDHGKCPICRARMQSVIKVWN